MSRVLPLSKRPFDVAVVVFLISHIPITVLIDSQALLPARLYPAFATNAFRWYLQEYQDPLLPFFFVAAYAHAYGKRWIQKPTILYGLFVSSTMVCILGELLLNTHSGHPRYLLTAFYLPYFICPFAMAMRMLSTAHPFVARNRLGDKQA